MNTIAKPALDKMRATAEAEISRLAKYTRGEVGVAAQHLGNGLQIAVDAGGYYPPASTIKIPVALAILDKVDRRELKLTDMVDVRNEEMNSAGPISEEFLHPGVSLSVANLLEPMITRSCNTATDVLFRLLGGPGAVQSYLRRLGVEEFGVQRTMRVALSVMHDIPLPPPEISFRDALRGQPPEVLDARNRMDANFHHDKRDMCTPRAMLGLLVRLWKGELLSAESRALLLAMMTRTTTGRDRVHARLPYGASFAHKSGSGAGTAVEAGYLSFPTDGATIAVGVFVKSSRNSMAERERVMADIGRLLYDYFLMTESLA